MLKYEVCRLLASDSKRRLSAPAELLVLALIAAPAALADDPTFVPTESGLAHAVIDGGMRAFRASPDDWLD